MPATFAPVLRPECQPGEGLGEYFKPFCKHAMSRYKLTAQDAEDATQECLIMLFLQEKRDGVNRDRPLLFRKMGQAVYYHLKRMVGHKDQVPTKYAFYSAEHVAWDSLDDLTSPRRQSAEDEVMGRVLDEKYDPYWDLSDYQKKLLGLVQVGFYPVEIGAKVGKTKGRMHGEMSRIRDEMRKGKK